MSETGREAMDRIAARIATSLERLQTEGFLLPPAGVGHLLPPRPFNNPPRYSIMSDLVIAELRIRAIEHGHDLSGGRTILPGTPDSGLLLECIHPGCNVLVYRRYSTGEITVAHLDEPCPVVARSVIEMRLPANTDHVEFRAQVGLIEEGEEESDGRA